MQHLSDTKRLKPAKRKRSAEWNLEVDLPRQLVQTVYACNSTMIDERSTENTCWESEGHYVRFCGDSFGCTTCGSSFDVGWDPPTSDPSFLHAERDNAEKDVEMKRGKLETTSLRFVNRAASEKSPPPPNGTIACLDVIDTERNDYPNKNYVKSYVLKNNIPLQRLNQVADMRRMIESRFDGDPKNHRMALPDGDIMELLQLYALYRELYNVKDEFLTYMPLCLRLVQLIRHCKPTSDNTDKSFRQQVRRVLKYHYNIPVVQDRTTSQIYVPTSKQSDPPRDIITMDMKNVRIILTLLHRILVCYACNDASITDTWSPLLRHADNVMPIVIDKVHLPYAIPALFGAERPTSKPATADNPSNLIESILQVHENVFKERDRKVLLHRAKHDPEYADKVLQGRRAQLASMTNATLEAPPDAKLTRKELADRRYKLTARKQSAEQRLETTDDRVDDDRYQLVQLAYGATFNNSLTLSFVKYIASNETRVGYNDTNGRMRYVVWAFLFNDIMTFTQAPKSERRARGSRARGQN
eukprot:gene10503-12425_t